uniref:Protein BZR1 homolog n=1 Tax=Oryza barthii TaxID=65489 RepID=A0A0D3F2U1_9ORYZ
MMLWRWYWSLDRIEAAHVKKGLVKEAIMETKGCKPPASELADQLGRSPSASPCSSYQPSPRGTLVAPPPNPFGAAAAAAGSSSRVMSGACSPVAGGDVQMADAARREFAFGGEGGKMTGLVKAWEGERIHEECGSDDLELTLGSSMTRGDR